MTKLPNLLIMRKLGFEPDPWQLQVLEGNHRRLLLNCCRQAGKSTVVAVLALLEALTVPGAVILLLSRSQRQSTELFRLTADFFRRLEGPFFKRRIANELEFTTGSRILSLPCNPDAIRGFANVHMLVIDEASRVPDELYKAVRPMLAASNGRLICLSTPNGKHGFFHDAWARGGADWHRIAVRAQEVPRIEASFLEEEQRSLGDSYFRQEYECSFESLQGLVYPDFERLTTPDPATILAHHSPLTPHPLVGGLDFGFRNPFAALWGHLDRDRVLWLTGEHYERLQPLSHHVQFLPKKATWYADPSGAADIAELQRAGFIVRKGNNELRPGIGAVTSRLRAGGLRILPNACPQLLQEATLYRWSSPSEGAAETPVDEDNHALAALRYLVTRLDEGKLRLPKAAAPPPGAIGGQPAPTSKWLSVHNEELWTRIL